MIIGLKTNIPSTIEVRIIASFVTIDYLEKMGELALITGGYIILALSFVLACMACMACMAYHKRKNNQKSRKRYENGTDSLERTLPAFKLTEKKQLVHKKDLCSICLAELGSSYIRKTLCGHMFHRKCLD